MQKALVRKQSSQSPSPQSALVSAALKLPRAFYEQKTISVAKQLLGKYLIRKHPQGDTVGRIAETEAYVGPQDLACHAAKWRTARTEVMFGQAGHAYVYFIYGFYNMLNLVTEKEGYPAAVLIRAVEPVDGVDLMKSRRGLDKLRELASGPGNFARRLPSIAHSTAPICSTTSFTSRIAVSRCQNLTPRRGLASITLVSGKINRIGSSFAAASSCRSNTQLRCKRVHTD